MKWYRILHKLIIYLPYINLLSLGSMILYVWITKGKMPSYNMPDPKEITFIYPIYFVSFLSCLILLIIYPIFLLSCLLAKFPYKYINALIFFIGLGLMILPYFNKNIANWIAD